MVTHRPLGSGHPYAFSPDQRVPVHPLVGQSVRLGVVMSCEVGQVWCEVCSGDETWWISAHQHDEEAARGDTVHVSEETVCLREGEGSAGATEERDVAETHSGDDAPGEGHLAEAQARVDSTGVAWHVILEDLQPFPHRYRFVARPRGSDDCSPRRRDHGNALMIDQGGDFERHLGAVRQEETDTTTEWFEFTPAQWTPTGSFPAVLSVRSSGSQAPRPSGVEWLTDDAHAYRVRFWLPLATGEHVVGFGERYDAVDQRGLTPDCVVFEQYKGQGTHHRTYFPMPFAHVIGGTGWGFHVRTSARVWFDIGVSSPDRLLVEAELVHRLGAPDPEASLAIDLYEGGPLSVLSDFLNDVGRAEELPEWVHRLWASGNEWNTQNMVLTQMDAHRDHEIPVGVVVIEAWSDEEGITIFRDAQYDVRSDGSPHIGSDFTYPADGAWPDPKAMVNELHSRGIRVILWQIPLMKSAETFACEGQRHGEQIICDGEAMIAANHAIREEDDSPYHNRGWWFPRAIMPDFSTAEGRSWWVDRRRYLVADLDVDGFKTDGGEHAWGAELRYADGTRGITANNLNPVRYARAYGDLLRSCGKAPVTFSRSGFTGSQAHGAFWAGDEDSTWEAFRASIRAGITAGASGVVYWGWDLAGFSGPLPDPELYLRAAAASVFMPIMQYHSEFNHHRLPCRDRTPWNIAEQSGDSSVINDFRQLAMLRERLLGYIAGQASRAIETDAPLMRALFFEWPDDSAIWDHPFEYMFGDALLVHPVCEEGLTAMRTYLPAGRWVDVWTGEMCLGGRVVETDVARRTTLPVFCRAEAWRDLVNVFAQG